MKNDPTVITKTEMILEELKNNLTCGRMISNSKSTYRNQYLLNKVCFNGNIFMFNKENQTYEKIWWGDIDITLEGEVLQNIAKKLDVTLYILSEMDGRFDNEKTQEVITKSIWNTDEPLLPEITEDLVIAFKEKQKSEYIYMELLDIQKEQRTKEYNKFAKTIKWDSDNFVKEIKIPYELLFNKYLEIEKEVFKNPKNKNLSSEKISKKFYGGHGYLSAFVFEEFLKQEFDLETVYPSYVWMTPETNQKIIEIDLKVERIFNSNFSLKDFQRECTCNYCVFNYHFLNNDNINMNSYKEDCFYISSQLLK